MVKTVSLVCALATALLTLQPPSLATPNSSCLLSLALLRMCAARPHDDDGKDLLPRHREDIESLKRSPIRLNEKGEWDSVDKGLWQLQAAYDLVGMVEAYVEIAEQVIPEFMVNNTGD